MRIEYWQNIKQHASGGYFIPLPKAHADVMMKSNGLKGLTGEEVKVEVTL